ncbi:membrane protein of unknown function [Candidatus Hydrogenisulfobacillus filiaventi]|uniref:Glycosyltransferase RgtA/B/C/D-like domain-containing protein n=1 Tax=Candidatus Hydrogenisulfobacillus filiaventi TaxID=2707344 RepID=A0A6F8ZDI0_9FIRM|nr:membrane protein of unknown function [Candidatus Hydrogenisulfobacillus filiaventi]
MASLGSFLGVEGLGAWSWTLAFTAVLTALGIARLQLGMAGTEGLAGLEQSLYLLWTRGGGAIASWTGDPVLTQGTPAGLWLLAPVLAAGGTGALLTLQALALGSGYLLLTRLGRRWGVPPATARLVGVAYLLSPVVWGAALADMHPAVLAVPFLLGVVWAVAADRRVAFRLLAAGLLLFLPAAPLALVGVAGVLALHRRWGWALEAVLWGAAAAGLDAAWWGRGSLDLLTRTWFGADGATPAAVLRAWGADPARLLAWARSLRAWEYLVWMLGPLAVPLTAGWLRGRLSAWLLPAALLLAASLAATAPAATSPFLPWSLPAVAFLYVAALSMLRGLAPGRTAPLLGGLTACLFLAVFGYHQRQTVWSRRPPAGTVLAAAVAVVPPRAPVVTQAFLAPFLAGRGRLWLPAAAPAQVPAGTYLVLEPGYSSGSEPAGAAAAWATQAATAGAPVVFRQDGLVVYRTVRPLARPV